MKKIVVVGGGAGGLELVTKLGRQLGRKGRAEITLVDATSTHIWKPLLHKVAAGTMNTHEDELAYLTQGYLNHFKFTLGQVIAVDPENKTITLAPRHQADGAVLIPERQLPYDYLVLAVGSVCHDFGVPGVREHCEFLDTTTQASHFQQRLLEVIMQADALSSASPEQPLTMAIVGAGATGIELAAQLRQMVSLLKTYGMSGVDWQQSIRISVLEAADRILPALNERISSATHRQMEKLGIQLHTGQQVTQVSADGITTRDGQFFPAQVKVWAAGIRAPQFLSDIAGLEHNKINQLVVNPHLQTTDASIFALGDCAARLWHEDQSINVPPRAQSAHQMARIVRKNIIRLMQQKPLLQFKYKDYGSLVSLGKTGAFGHIMSSMGGSVMIQGAIARTMYLWLYKMHQLAVMGVVGTFFLSLSQMFRKVVHAKIKLH